MADLNSCREVKHNKKLKLLKHRTDNLKAIEHLKDDKDAVSIIDSYSATV